MIEKCGWKQGIDFVTQLAPKVTLIVTDGESKMFNTCEKHFLDIYLKFLLRFNRWLRYYGKIKDSDKVPRIHCVNHSLNLFDEKLMAENEMIDDAVWLVKRYVKNPENMKYHQLYQCGSLFISRSTLYIIAGIHTTNMSCYILSCE